ncbi:MAG: hypothetical protein LBE25_04885 [Arthrobacter sp.]|jgi:ABC-type multidrug transport system fused ATPase/permease subunit|nr:hypothetical protein [Arthrobacter sp.]
MPEIITGAEPRQKKNTPTLGLVGMGVLVLALLVAVLFAANSNQVVGWIVAIIAGLWLVLAAIIFFVLRTGAKAVGRKWDQTNANLAAKVDGSTDKVTVIDEAERNHELKLDHSFKIIQVQHGVVMENLRKGTSESAEMVERALDTIEITASNARDMIKERRKARHTTAVDGEIIEG